MKKRFIVSLNSFGTQEQNAAFVSFLDANKAGWWHWLGGTWLLIDWRGNWTASSLRDALRTIYPGAWFLVSEIPTPSPVVWAGIGPDDPVQRERMQNWLRQVWDT